MRMTQEELSNLLDRMKKAVDEGFFQGELLFDYTKDAHEVSGSCFLEGKTLKFPKVPRIAECGHEIKFGLLGCSCD